jgi:hypothetical protein
MINHEQFYDQNRNKYFGQDMTIVSSHSNQETSNTYLLVD